MAFVDDGGRFAADLGSPDSPQQERLLDFLEVLGVCHTVIPEPNEDVLGGIEYQAASPDEVRARRGGGGAAGRWSGGRRWWRSSGGARVVAVVAGRFFFFFFWFGLVSGVVRNMLRNTICCFSFLEGGWQQYCWCLLGSIFYPHHDTGEGLGDLRRPGDKI